MSIPRFLVAATVVITAALVAPAAIPAGFNGADLVVTLAPVALLGICLSPRRHKLPAGGASSPTDTD